MQSIGEDDIIELVDISLSSVKVASRGSKCGCGIPFPAKPFHHVVLPVYSILR